MCFQSFSLLLGQPSHVHHINRMLDGKSVKPSPVTKEMPLGLYSLVASLRPPLVTYLYSSTVNNAGWPLLETLIVKFRQLQVELRRALNFPLRWFAKGADEITSLDRLVAFWISFNGLYHDTDKIEREAIKSYVRSNVDPEMAQRFVKNNRHSLKMLSSYPIKLGRKGKIPIAQQLAELYKAKQRDHVAIVEAVTLTIYGVRNTVFHGGCDPYLGADQKQIEICEQLLSVLVKDLISKKILGYPLPAVKFTAKQTFGF